MAMEQVAALVRLAARDAGFAEALGGDPAQLRSVLGLTDAHMAALHSAEALAPRPGGEVAAAVAAETGTLYPPEGSGTMALDYVVIPAPGVPPQVPVNGPGPPLPPLAPPPSLLPAPQPPPAPSPRPAPVPPVAPLPAPAIPIRMPIPGPQPAVPKAPPQPGPPLPPPTPAPRHRPPAVAAPAIGFAGGCCCGAVVAGIAALASNTAITAITALTAIAGRQK